MADIFSFDPFVELGAYRDALRQLVESGMLLPRDLLPSAVASVVVAVDVLDTGPEIVVMANLPGVKAEDVQISVVGTSLSIKGSVQVSKEYEGSHVIRRERRATGFVRTVQLPVEVDADRAAAKFSNGVLTLTLPKSETIRPRMIKVESE